MLCQLSYTRMFGTVGGSRTRRGARFELAASSCCATTVCGTLAATRTRGLLRRRQTLYPSELQGHMETAGGVEPPFTGLQPVALPLGCAVKWSEWGGSNALPRGPRPRALPDELHPDMAAADGVEPPSPGSEPGVLPMYYAAIWRLVQDLNLRPSG